MKLKQWQNIFNVIVNESSIVLHVIQTKNGIIKDNSWNPSICIFGNSKYLKSIAGTLLTKCD